MSLIKKTGVSILVIFALAQFVQPEKNEGKYNLKPFFEQTNASEKIQVLIFKACADCHSNNTKYPWYSQISPVNFWMKDHVDEGKKHLNFSEWSAYSVKKKAHKLKEIYEEVAEKEMPLNSYTWTHREAKLTPKEIKLIVNWAKKEKEKF